MKSTTFAASLFLLATSAVATPIDYTPPGGWGSVKYPPGTGENLPYYPPPPGGWESVSYPAGTGAGAGASASGASDGPFTFTSTYHVTAVGSEVRNGTVSVPGPADAVGFFRYGINAPLNTICYNITLLNVVGEYMSPALTATHIHQAARGASGPPRIAFPNPVGDDKFRNSIGCIKGPFLTGVKANGIDTGTGFNVGQIEANPAGFFTDSHTKLFSLGVVRGQLA